MELNDLKGALFGFKKHDVCEYIAQINTEFSAKLAEERKEYQQTLEELSAKNEKLYQELVCTATENDELRRERARYKKMLADLQKEMENLKQEQTGMHINYDAIADFLPELTKHINGVLNKAACRNAAAESKSRPKDAACQEKRPCPLRPEAIRQYWGNALNALGSSLAGSILYIAQKHHKERG